MTSAELRRVLGRAKKFEGVFVGGPPCQPFSIAANQRFSKSGDDFKRIGYAHKTNGNLLFHYIALIAEFKPAAFVIENVPGLLDIDGGAQVQDALGKLTSLGYSVEKPFIVNAAHHFVPQHRLRLFIVGSRRKGGFKKLPINPAVPSYAALSRTFSGLLNHETRSHKAESLLRYMKLKYGERDQLGRVDRLSPHLPSKTVIAGGTNGGGRSHLHPVVPRTISVRECARLQTFPDNYVFLGPTARQFTQVGNAIPPVLAAQIANQIKLGFFDR